MDAKIYLDRNSAKVFWLPSAATFFRLEYDTLQDFNVRSSHNIDFDVFNVHLQSSTLTRNFAEDNYTIAESFYPVISGFRIVLTEACNFACDGCFSTTAMREAGQRLRTMSVDTLDQVIRQIIPYGRDREIALHFFGGEPLLKLPLIRHAVEQFKEAVRKGEMLSPRYAITTNGSILNDDIIEFLVLHGVHVGVSFEESEEIHNRIRVRKGMNQPTFDAIVRNYHKLASCSVNVHPLVNPRVPIMPTFVDALRHLMERLPMKTVTINTPYQSDSLEWIVSREYVDVLIECHKLGTALNVEVESALSPCLAAIAYGTPRRSPQCKIGCEITAGVDTQGRLIRSTHKWFDELATDKWESFKLGVNRSEKCSNCEARALCGGPNEEFQLSTGRRLDEKKCGFYQAVPAAIARNLDLFEETDY